MTKRGNFESTSRAVLFTLLAVLMVSIVVSQPALASSNGNGHNGNGHNGNGHNGNGHNGNGHNGNGHNGNGHNGNGHNGNGHNGNGSLVANSQSITTDENVSVTVNLTGSGPNGFTYEIATYPTHGSLTGTAPSITYVPDADYFGADSFTFHTQRGGHSSQDATISITINEVVVNHSPSSEPSTTCDEGYHLEDNACIPDVIDPPALTCDEGYHEENDRCVEDQAGEDGSVNSGSNGGSTDTNNDTSSKNISGNGSNDNDNNNGQQQNTADYHRSWEAAIKFAERTKNIDFRQVPESTTGLTLYQAVNGPLGLNYVDLLMSFDLNVVHSSDMRQGQMVWLLEHFDELMGQD